MNEAQLEAVANADAHTSSANLPTYTELLAALSELHATTTALFEAGIGGGVIPSIELCHRMDRAEETARAVITKVAQ